MMDENIGNILLAEIRENRKCIQALMDRVARLEERSKLLSAMWGILGGIIPALALILYKLVGG